MKKFLFLESFSEYEPDYVTDYSNNIWDAISRNDIEYIKRYIDSGKDLNLIKDGLFSENHTLLTYAINHETEINNKVVKILLYGGCDPEKSDKNGNTPLMTAVFYDNLEITKILIINYDVDINKRNINNLSALTESIRQVNRDTFVFLLKNGAKFESQEIGSLYRKDNPTFVEILKMDYPQYFNKYDKYVKKLKFNL